MLSVTLDDTNKIALLEPRGSLTEEDFTNAASSIDPWLEKLGSLKGLIIHARTFPGWDSFAAFSSHLVFVKEHHKNIRRIALVTDSLLGNAAETLARHFLKAQVETFAFDELDKARDWILSANQ